MSSGALNEKPSFFFNKRHRLVHVFVIVIALIMGALDAWGGRGSFVDGDSVSYLDMAMGIAGGDVGMSINGYWSPLYPLYLSVFIRPFQNNMHAVFIAVRIANFVLFLATIIIFELFLHFLLIRIALLRSHRQDHPDLLQRTAFIVSAYMIFLWACFSLNMVCRVSPDNGVLAMVLAGSAILLAFDNGVSRGKLVLFGAVLGIGYWVKAIMFPVGCIFMCAALLRRRIRTRWRRIALIIIPFALVAAPLIIAVSGKCHRITFGETSRLNYAWFINHVTPLWIHWQGGPGGHGTPLHPTRKIHSSPDVFEFGYPIKSTYPPWFDPSYWYEGVKTDFNPVQQAKAMVRSILSLAGEVKGTWVCWVAILVALIPAFRQKNLRGLVQGVFRLADLWMVGLGMIGLYVLSHLEARHIAGPLCLVLFLVLALVRIKPGHAKIIVLILCAACAAAVGPRLADVAVTGLKNHGVIRNSHWKVAEEFARIGIPPGIPVASIGNAAFNDWAFLAQARVVAEIPSDMYWLYFMRPMHAVEQFWSSSKQEKDLVLDLMRQAGARVAVSNEVSENADVSGWTRIPDSEFWYRVLDPAL